MRTASVYAFFVANGNPNHEHYILKSTQEFVLQTRNAGFENYYCLFKYNFIYFGRMTYYFKTHICNTVELAHKERERICLLVSKFQVFLHTQKLFSMLVAAHFELFKFVLSSSLLLIIFNCFSLSFNYNILGVGISEVITAASRDT